jgi:hypothetical protein
MNLRFLISLFITFFLVTFSVIAQNTFSISGKISESKSDAPLTGAGIIIKGTNKGTVADQSGYYTFILKPGKYILQISFVGYKTILDSINLYSDVRRNYEMTVTSLEAQEVIISSRDLSANVHSTSTAIISLTAKDIKALPSLMGEADVLHVIQLTPGVQSANEGNSGFYVRGGGADQNLVLFDNATVYNPSHVLGFFSVFNSDIIKDVTLVKSGMTADLGSRLSSIVEINTLDPNSTNYNVIGSIGLISSKLTVTGPIIKNKVLFYIAGRRSYLDEVLKPLVRPFINGGSSFYNYSNYYFDDLNAKLLLKFSKIDRVAITFYTGNDFYKLNQNKLNYKNQLNWGNTLLSATYKRIISEKWYFESTADYTKYKFDFSASQYNVNIGLISAVEDLNYKLKFNKIEGNRRIIFGLDYQYHHFVPNNLDATANGLKLDFGPNRNLYAHEMALFYNQEFDIGSRSSISAGLRYSLYLYMGPYTDYIKNKAGEVIDTVQYSNDEIIKKYNNLEPRVTFKYQLTLNSSIKAAYTRHVQYVLLASATSVALPTDVWLPCTDKIKPQKSDHYTIGYYQNFRDELFSFSTEVYYKDLKDQIELLYGFINNFQDNTFEESMVFGRGRSYGIEFYISKNKGKLTGWIGYTLSRTEKQFDEINNGIVYPAKYDRTHDLNIICVYNLSRKLSLSGTFIYATGSAMTIPEYKYLIAGNVITGYSGTNAFRMPSYNRLDLSANYVLKKNKKYESSLNLSIYNVYNRANPYFIYFEITGDVYEYNLKITPKQVTLFPIIPSISWEFKF